jgi:hypothetical protein
MASHKFFAILVLAPILFCALPCSAAPEYVRLTVPQKVSVEIPRTWTVMNGDERLVVDRLVKTIAPWPKSSNLPFVANLLDSSGLRRAHVNLRFYPEPLPSQLYVRQSTEQAIQLYDGIARENVSSEVLKYGSRLISWDGTRAVSVGGWLALVGEYRRQGTGPERNDIYRVKLVRVLDESRSFTLTVSFRERDGFDLQSICNHIIESLRREVQ